jgi:hypothetical protein
VSTVNAAEVDGQAMTWRFATAPEVDPSNDADERQTLSPYHGRSEAAHVVRDLLALMSECLDADAACRPSAAAVQRRLEELLDFARAAMSEVVISPY